MRITYVAIVYVTKGLTKSVKNTIKEKFENPDIISISSVEGFERLRVKDKSSENIDSFQTRLNEIKGVGKTTIVEETFRVPKISKWVLRFILVGLVISLIIFTIFTYFTPKVEDAGARFEVFTNAETLIIEILFAISLTIYLIFREKKWQKGVSDALVEIQIIASEIKQYVIAIEKRNLDKTKL